MGTTRSYLLLKNRGFTPEALEQLIPLHIAQERESAKKEQHRMAQRMGLGEEFFAMFAMLDNFKRHGAVAYREDARWLPYFTTELCDGHICSSKELVQTSELFQTSVLCFSVFDSDILFVSYCDAEKRIFYDYAKPNVPGDEEYDTELYQEDLPTFLLSLDGGDNVQRIEDVQKLKAIWDEEGLVDADDRMLNLLKFLGMQVVYDENDIPEGFIRIGL